jgi:hypothetical protein
MSKRRPVALLVGVLAASTALTLAVGVFVYVTDPIGEKLKMGKACLSQKKASVLNRFGKPTCEHKGYIAPVREEYVKAHPVSVTLEYRCRSGTLYLSFEPVNGEWVCYDADWLPEGFAF